jgi:hypothetical protein
MIPQPCRNVSAVPLAGAPFRRRADVPRNVFGDLMVVGFLVVQCLDGICTYLGVTFWGPGIEANPLIGAAMAAAGLTAGLAGAKLVAVASGILLHLLRVHYLVAALTALYVVVALLPWAILLVR